MTSSFGIIVRSYCHCVFGANYWAITEITTYIGSSIYQRSDTGHVSRQAGFMERGHVIDGDNVGGMALKVGKKTEPLQKVSRALTIAAFTRSSFMFK